MVPELGGLAKRLANDRVECDDPPDKFTACRLCIREFGSGQCQCAGKSARYFGGNGGEQCGQPATCVTEIGSKEHHAGRHDANADLGAADHGEHKDFAVCAPGCPELTARDDCRRDPGKLRRKG
jgi:hypothetical protein